MAESLSIGADYLSIDDLDLRAFTPVIKPSIELDKKLKLAENPLPMNKSWVAESKAKDTVTDLLVGYVKSHYSQDRFQLKKYWPAVNMVIANGFYSYKKGGQVLYSRRTNHSKDLSKNPENITDETIIKVVDALIHYGYLKGKKGEANEYQKIKSWFECTEKLISVLSNAEVFIRKSKHSPPIVLRDKSKKARPISKHNKEVRLAKRLARPVDDFNSFWLEHNASVDGAPVVPFLHRVFNINLNWGGRFYGEYQTLKKINRSRILIDGRPTVELDYSGLHINLLYAEVGVQLLGDAYDRIGLLDDSLTPAENRALLKMLMLKFVNSESIGAFKSNVTKSGKSEIKKQYRDEYLKIAPYLSKKEREKRFPQMKGFTDGVPDNLQGDTVVQMILTAHPQIKDLFNEVRIGSKLQFKDSEIMSSCLTKLIALKVPALPVHDSIICPVDCKVLVYDAMMKAYSEHTNGLKIEVK